MRLRPLHDRILLVRVTPEAMTAGGLYIPESAQETPQEAIVRAVGPGRRRKNGKRVPIDVRVGDRVSVSDYCGYEIVLDGQMYTVAKEDELRGVLT